MPIYPMNNLAINERPIGVFGVQQDFDFPTIYFAKKKLRNKFDLSIFKSWFKFSWVVLYSTIPSYLKNDNWSLYYSKQRDGVSYKT